LLQEQGAIAAKLALKPTFPIRLQLFNPYDDALPRASRQAAADRAVSPVTNG
jgi:hypothetical protein